MLYKNDLTPFISEDEDTGDTEETPEDEKEPEGGEDEEM